jgi:autotransporter-associated beta strand protein
MVTARTRRLTFLPVTATRLQYVHSRPVCPEGTPVMNNRLQPRPRAKHSPFRWFAISSAVALVLAGRSAIGTTYDWSFDGGGNWSDSLAGGWNAAGAFPSAIDDVANLTLDLTAPATVVLDVTNATVGILNLNDTGASGDVAWTIASADAANNKLTFDVSSGNAALNSAGGANVISAPIVLNDTVDITTTNALNLSGVISGPGGLSKFMTGQTLTLSGSAANTYTGLTTVNAGTLSLAKTAGQNAIGGDLTMNAGAVTLTAANQIADGAIITMSGGTLTLGAFSETINTLNVTGVATVSTSGATATLTVTNATTLATGANVTTNANNGTRTFNLGALTLSGGTLPGNASSGNGRTVLTASSVTIINKVSGAYTPLTLQISATGTNSQSSSLTFTGDFNFQKAPGDANGNPVTIGNTGNGAAQLIMSSTVNATHTFNIEDGLAPVDLILAPRLGGGGNNLVKAGAGALELDGPNTFSGTSKIVAGTLILGSDAASTTVLGATVTASSATDLFTLTGNTLVEGNRIAFSASTPPTTSPANGLVTGGIYFVRNVSGNTFQLSATATSTPFDLTTNGTSVQLTRVGALGATNSVVTLGDAALTQPTDTITLVSSGAFTNERALSVVDAGAGTTIGATNAAGTTATYTGAITLGKNVILGAANLGATTNFKGLLDDGVGSFSVSTSGLGIVNLSAPAGNTYDGGTTVNSGTLLVNNVSGSATGTAAVTVGVNGALGGAGIIAGDTNIFGAHRPGNGPGIQTFTTNLTYHGGATAEFEFAANTSTQGTPTAVFDQVVIGAAVDFGTSTTLSLAFNGSGSTVDWSDAFWQMNRSWLLYDAASASNFSALALNSIDWLDAQGDSFAAALPNSNFFLSQSAGDVTLNYLTVPEPSACLFLGLAAINLRPRRRR